MVGPSNARVKVIAFTDLECPFCARFNDALHAARSVFPNDVAYVLIHSPLPIHRFAEAAARAVECADQPGKFVEMVDVVFDERDSLGLIPWPVLGQRAGIQDTSAFAKCISSTAPAEPIRSGVLLARKFGVTGTPTVILNGWRYGIPPSDTELVRAARDILGGRPPYPGFPVAELRH